MGGAALYISVGVADFGHEAPEYGPMELLPTSIVTSIITSSNRIINKKNQSPCGMSLELWLSSGDKKNTLIVNVQQAAMVRVAVRKCLQVRGR